MMLELSMWNDCSQALIASDSENLDDISKCPTCLELFNVPGMFLAGILLKVMLEDYFGMKLMYPPDMLADIES